MFAVANPMVERDDIPVMEYPSDLSLFCIDVLASSAARSGPMLGGTSTTRNSAIPAIVLAVHFFDSTLPNPRSIVEDSSDRLSGISTRKCPASESVVQVFRLAERA